MATDGSPPSGGLVTQGALDWVALSKKTVSVSVEVLARYSSAGVEPLTIAIGQALFAQFNVPANAQRKVELSVCKLKAFSSAANALWFGIGFKHLIRTLMETEQGINLVAISSSLMISYDREFSATVLKELCDKSATPELLTPAPSQWAAFVNLCAPVVVASQFPILVEGFSRLLMNKANKKSPTKVVATSPSELAAAMLELAQLSTRKLANLTLIGNADCGWLAALAEWLFLLRVEIVDANGNPLYQSQGEGREDIGSFHLTIVRLEDGRPTSRQNMLHSRTQLVPPGDLGFDLRPHDLFYRGRSEWCSILNDTFGSFFKRLLEPDTIPLFAQVLYSGLRVEGKDHKFYQLYLQRGTSFGNNSIKRQIRFMQRLSCAAARLPELTEVEAYTKGHAAELDGLDKDQPYGDDELISRSSGLKRTLIMGRYSLALLHKCSCRDCQVHSPQQVDASLQPHQCLSRIAISIIEFIKSLSWLDIDDTIRPSSHGLVSLCFEEHIFNRNLMYKQGQTFRFLIQILTGFRVRGYEETSAASVHGLCIYRSCLMNPNGEVEGQLRMRVVPGQIERNGKIYGYVKDGTDPWLRKNAMDFGENQTSPDTLIMSGINILGAYPPLQIAIEETFDVTSLNAKFIVLPQTRTQIPRDLTSANYVRQGQHQEFSFVGRPAEMCRRLMSSLHHHDCQNTHSLYTKNPSWNPNQVVKPWSGCFSLADLPWWTVDPCNNQQKPIIPQSDQWVLSFSNAQMILGSPSFLFCMSATLNKTYPKPSLFKSHDCLLCLQILLYCGQKFSVHSLTEGRVQKLELAVHWPARNDVMVKI